MIFIDYCINFERSEASVCVSTFIGSGQNNELIW